MIWEVDDDCDKRVNWNEFQAMFMRCRNDKTGACAACSVCNLANTAVDVPPRRQGTSPAGCTTLPSSS